jgi:uncharacterized protein HemY
VSIAVVLAAIVLMLCVVRLVLAYPISTMHYAKKTELERCRTEPRDRKVSRVGIFYSIYNNSL